MHERPNASTFGGPVGMRYEVVYCISNLIASRDIYWDQFKALGTYYNLSRPGCIQVLLAMVISKLATHHSGNEQIYDTVGTFIWTEVVNICHPLTKFGSQLTIPTELKA